MYNIIESKHFNYQHNSSRFKLKHFFSVLRLSPNPLVEMAPKIGPPPKRGITDPKEAACLKDLFPNMGAAEGLAPKAELRQKIVRKLNLENFYQIQNTSTTGCQFSKS